MDHRGVWSIGGVEHRGCGAQGGVDHVTTHACTHCMCRCTMYMYNVHVHVHVQWIIVSETAIVDSSPIISLLP